MQTSGVIFDVYDDSQGDLLRSVYPGFDAIPFSVKTAAVLSSDDRERLPDEVFALVLQNGPETLRKFACIDAGNTELAVQYFLKTAQLLPEAAQKVAAANLQTACGWYSLPVPELVEKIALGLGTVMTLAEAPSIVKGTSQAIKGNLAAVRAVEGSGQQALVHPQQMSAIRKMGEAGNTDLMPAAGSSTKPIAKAVVAKTAALGHLVKGHARESGETLAVAEGIAGKAPLALPQGPVLHPHVDVTGSGPKKHVTEKKAAHYALRGRYPLDSYAQVKAAAAYFDEHGKRFSPADRHAYCIELTKRASELDIDVSDDALKYGSETFAPHDELKVAEAVRRSLLEGNDDALTLLDGLYEKRASLEPALFCAALEEFDKVAGLEKAYDEYVPDAHYSTYGRKSPAPFRETIGNDTVNGAQLGLFALKSTLWLSKVFDGEFQHKFQQDPVGVFKTLPRAQKVVIMRMAALSAPGEVQ